MQELKLFVSHSSRDKAVAYALATLFQKALRLSAREIRCTSVEAYKLDAGVDADEALREEVFGAKAFIGLLTPESLASAYVLFELGARWGAKKPLAPVLARGATPASLTGPLRGLNALRADESPDVMRLLENVASSVGVTMEPIHSLHTEIASVVREALVHPVGAAGDEHEIGSAPEATERRSLDETEIQILRVIEGGDGDPERIASVLKLRLEKAKFYLHGLVEERLISNVNDFMPEQLSRPFYQLTQGGRQMLIIRGFL